MLNLFKSFFRVEVGLESGQLEKKMTYCFDTEESCRLFALLYPDLAAQSVAYSAVVEELADLPLLSATERVTLFAELAQTQEPVAAERYLKTLEALRKALVLTHDHVAHCFHELDLTPKNQALRNLMHLYLDSPLAQDEAAAVWRAVSRLKEQAHAISLRGDIIAVRSASHQLLFQEFAKALSYAKDVESVRLQSFSEIWDSTPREDASYGKGDPVCCIEQLTEEIARELEKGTKPSQLFVPFQGKPETALLLRCALERHKIPYRWALDSDRTTSFQDPLATWIEKIRTDPTREPLHRLKLAHILSQFSRDKHSTLSFLQFFEELRSRNLLSSSDHEYCQTLWEKQIDAAKAAPPLDGVIVFPFEAVPVREGVRVFAFCDESLFEWENSDLLFSEMECNALFQAGFSLPRRADQKARVLDAAVHWMKMPQAKLFTSLTPRDLPEGTPKLLEKILVSSMQVYEETPVPIASSILSATQLETYAQCPTKYFFASKARLRPSDRMEDRFPLLYGQAVHLALEIYFKESATNTSSLLECFSQAVQKTIPALSEKQPLHTILFSQFKRQAALVPGLEKHLGSLFPGHKPIAFEAPFTVTIEGQKVTGKIDRIDAVEDAVVILDYKTGNVDFCPDHIAQGHHFQALIYLLAAQSLFDKPCLGILFYDLKKGELRRGILREALISADAKKAITRGHALKDDKLAWITEQGLTHIRHIADRITAGDFTATPDAQACGRCDYPALCRRGVEHV